MGLSDTGHQHLAFIARRFEVEGRIVSISPIPGGHINEGYRVEVRDGSPRWYLLQRLNPDVFPNAERVMENIARVTRHLAGKPSATRAQVLALVPTTTGGAWVQDAAAACWRMYAFITGAHVQEHAASPETARTAARAFGGFIADLADYDGPPLHVTIQGFHDAVRRFERLEAAARGDTVGRSAGARQEIDAFLAQRHVADRFARLVAGGGVPVRIVHNDAKLSNVLLDDTSGAARCVVDLDTVMPGSALHDFGDMVRSMASGTAEDETDLLKVAVRYDLFEAVARGFLEGCGFLLTTAERDNLLLAGRLITLEQAVRFLTDYLEGDRYYRNTRGDQNLHRARAQFRLFESLTHSEDDLKRILAAITS